MDSVCEKAVRLFTYLKELSKLRTTHIKDISRYDETLWFSDIPKEKICHCVAWDLWNQKEDEKEKTKDVWIEVHKPSLKSPPEIPDELELWIKDDELSDSSLDEPGLRDNITIISEPDPITGEETTEILALDDHPDIFELWIKYTDEKWKPWAEEDKRLQKVQRVYNDLYSVYQRSEKLGEQYEVIIGVGFMLWRSPKGGEIRHPLLSLQARVNFDGARGIMYVSPSIDGPQPKLEIDMLEADDRPVVKDQQAIQEMVDGLNGEPWDSPALEAILKSLANCISTESSFDRSILKPSYISDKPQISFSPLLILRKRTRRSFVDFYRFIAEQIAEDEVVPEGIRGLVSIVGGGGTADEVDPNSRPLQRSPGDTELYFPLPANDEQQQIAQKIRHSKGILVQGPPGTGKSQAISNLIAHLLAKGKRVLVTSETPRALEVLANMLPNEIRELCVMWLGSAPQAQESLENSVLGITQRRTNWDATRTTSKINGLEKRLDSVRRSISKYRQELIACRESDTFKHTNIFELYNGTLENIAINVGKDKRKYEWFLDTPELDSEISVTPDELLELLEIDRALTDELISDFSKKRMPSDCLLSPEQFKKLTAAERTALELYKKIEQKRNYPGYQSLQVLPTETRQQILNLLNDLVGRIDQLSNHFHGWVDRAAREILADQDRVWRHLLDLTDQYLQELSEGSQQISELNISGLEDWNYYDVAIHAQALKDHLEAGKKLKYLGLFKSKLIKESWFLVKTVRVDGAPCKTVKELNRLLEWINYEKRLAKLDDQWKSYTSVPEGDYATRIAAYEDLCEPLREATNLHDIVITLKGLISECVDLLLPHWHIREDVISLRDAVEAVEYDEKLHNANAEFIPLVNRISEVAETNDAHPAVKSVLSAVEKRDIGAYEEEYKAILSLNESADTYKHSLDIYNRFRKCAPKTALAYRNSYHDECWDHRFRDFRNASNWAKADNWLKEMCSENRAAQLSKLLEQSEIDEKKIIQKLAAEKAWQHCMASLGEIERQALIAWMQAVKKIRGGTGRHAERYRREARRKLTECRGAIPAWVMPLYQVVQTTSPQRGLFDYIIVDEASQSGPEAILLNYIGNKIIVVGDDKQIAPLHVGINRDDVTRLQEMYLKGIPHRESYDLEGSFFSQAELRFSNRVRLREHFRCMPEIIQFSNRLSYNAEPLIPLRQFGADRLTPCKTTPVEGGYRKGSTPNIINEPEAKAIVRQIVECFENSEYEKKSFGVISLMGGAQATLIAKLLMQEIGAEEIENRKLLCGSPYDFQGDERDVVFLSMVDAPQDGRTCRMVRDSETQRRFNVAASRAKDQLWLFHTPTLNDLRTECLRYKLLEHCLNPAVEQSKIGDHNIDSLRKLAESERRDQINPPEPFDSWFEVDVFIRIAERGYRVIPQYEVANRKIDLYVEGLKGGLAVECHGDKWHGPDQYSKDMERRRQLERCGFLFKVIWGSQFYRNPDNALTHIWDELDRRNIYPEHRWEEERRREELSIEISTEDFNMESAHEVHNSSKTMQKAADGNDSSDQDLFSEYDGVKKKLSPRSIPARLIQNAIVSALNKCPHNTCTTKSLTKRVLKELGIITRGNPRLEFEKRVKRNVAALSQKGVIEEYKAKNNRLRLLH
ncbi:MAG: AAA domain-containing protein [Candidatus Kariarchaeaceae archaeon]|jgi:DNA polymerase III delta prime subunit/very-short-patch-repair endonuclease